MQSIYQVVQINNSYVKALGFGFVVFHNVFSSKGSIQSTMSLSVQVLIVESTT